MTSKAKVGQIERLRTNVSDISPRRTSKSELMERAKTSNAGDRKLSTVSERKQSLGIDRKTPNAMSDRKQSIAVGRRKSVAQPGTSRRLSNDQSSIAGQRRMSIFGDRESVSNSERRSSIVESTFGGRSALIMTSVLGQRPSTGVKYENTYKMQPDAKIKTMEVRNCIREIFEEELVDKEYCLDNVNLLSKSLAETIKQRVKFLGYFRHKIVSVVAIGQVEEYNPSATFTSRCVWNEHFDTYAEYCYRNSSLYAIGIVYLLYIE